MTKIQKFIMRLSLFTAAIVFFHAVSADRTVVVLYNNGVTTSTSGSCNDADLAKTQAVLEASGLNSTYGKRQLRTVMNDIDDMTESMLSTTGESQRALWPRNCKNDCAGIATGKCQEVGCKGYRRRQLGENDDRALLSGAAFTCTQQVDYINAELNKLVTQNLVQADCKTLLSKPRNITCFDDVIYGVVEYFKLWDSASYPYKAIYEYFTGQDVCINKQIAIEAMTNECVDSLRATLRGPNGFYSDVYEWEIPYTAFKSTLPYVGQYELTVLPDDILSKKKILKFNGVSGETVTAIRLRDVMAQTFLNANFTGGNVCNNKKVNFEAVTCATSARFALTNTNGYSHSNTESTAPFTVFPGDLYGTDNGQTLQNGFYTLNIYPNNGSTVKKIQFNVVNCP